MPREALERAFAFTLARGPVLSGEGDDLDSGKSWESLGEFLVTLSNAK